MISRLNCWQKDFRDDILCGKRQNFGAKAHLCGKNRKWHEEETTNVEIENMINR